MNKLPLWDIRCQTPGNASVPPESLVLELGYQARKEWVTTILLMRVWGDALPGGSVFTHNDGKREYKGQHLRIFFTSLPGRQIIIEKWQEVEQGAEARRTPPKGKSL